MRVSFRGKANDCASNSEARFVYRYRGGSVYGNEVRLGSELAQMTVAYGEYSKEEDVTYIFV